MPWTDNGFTPYTAQQALDVVNAEWVSIFGANVNLSPSSVNGQLIYQETNWLLNNENFINQLITNTFNPAIASGIYLDNICKFSGIERKSATHSIVNCTCYGSAGTIIPKGSQIANINNDAFTLVDTITIGVLGEVVGIFVANDSGNIECTANTVNNIISSVYGWDRVNNITDGVVGSDIQTDYSLRSERTDLLATMGSASLDALYAGLYNTPDVVSVFVAQNDTAVDIDVGGVTIQPGYIYCCVLGGTDTNIAKTIFKKKSPGVMMLGNTDVTIDTAYGTQWTATFERPEPTPLQVYIEVGNKASLPQDIATQIKDVVYNNFYGIDKATPNYKRVGIDELINTSRFVPSLLAIGVYDILDNKIGLAGSGATLAPFIKLNADKIATLDKNDIEVVLI